MAYRLTSHTTQSKRPDFFQVKRNVFQRNRVGCSSEIAEIHLADLVWVYGLLALYLICLQWLLRTWWHLHCSVLRWSRRMVLEIKSPLFLSGPVVSLALYYHGWKIKRCGWYFEESQIFSYKTICQVWLLCLLAGILESVWYFNIFYWGLMKVGEPTRLQFKKLINYEICLVSYYRGSWDLLIVFFTRKILLITCSKNKEKLHRSDLLFIILLIKEFLFQYLIKISVLTINQPCYNH